MHVGDTLQTKCVIKFKYPSVTLTFDLGTWFLHMTLHLIVLNICVKYD